MLEINLNILIIQAVSFLIVVFILWKIGWKPLTQFMADRKKSIEDDINNAKQSRENAILLEDDLKKKISAIEQEAKNIINKAIKEGEKNKEEIIQDAHMESKKVIEEARLEIIEQQNKAKRELQKEVVNLAVLISKKILKDNVDVKKQDKLIDDFVSRLIDEK